MKMETEQHGRCSEIVYLLLGSALWIVWFPFVLLTYLPLLALRVSTNIAARFFRPDLIPITNPQDSALISNPSKEFPITNCCQVWRLEGKLEVEKLRRHFYTVFLSNETLREKYANLYCFYVKWGLYIFKKKVQEINLEDRIHEISLVIGDGDEEKEIQRFVGEWIDTNNYGERPNWEILLVHVPNKNKTNTGEDQKTFVLFKIDHGLCDGYTFVHLVDKLSGIKSPYVVQEDSISNWELARLGLSLPAVLSHLLWKLAMAGKLPVGPLNPDARWFLSLTTLDLDKVKIVRRATQSHFNTVLGMLQVEALRKFLLETRRISSYSELPKYTFVPSPTGWPMHPAMTQGGMTNHLSLSFPRVPMREDDPVKRLTESEREFLDMKASGLIECFYYFVFHYSWPFPPELQKWIKATLGTFRVLSPEILCHCLSPLMLSQEKYKLLGVPAQNLYLPTHVPSFMPFFRMYVVPVSNGGKLDLSVSVRNDMIKSQEQVDRFTKFHMRNALDDLVRGCDTKKET